MGPVRHSRVYAFTETPARNYWPTRLITGGSKFIGRLRFTATPAAVPAVGWRINGTPSIPVVVRTIWNLRFTCMPPHLSHWSNRRYFGRRDRQTRLYNTDVHLQKIYTVRVSIVLVNLILSSIYLLDSLLQGIALTRSPVFHSRPTQPPQRDWEMTTGQGAVMLCGCRAIQAWVIPYMDARVWSHTWALW